MYSVNQMSLRQVITPVHLFGRVTEARRVLIFGLATAGAAMGGFMGEAFGLRTTLVWGALWFSAGFLLVLFSPCSISATCQQVLRTSKAG